jgi:hypothetical protein
MQWLPCCLRSLPDQFLCLAGLFIDAPFVSFAAVLQEEALYNFIYFSFFQRWGPCVATVQQQPCCLMPCSGCILLQRRLACHGRAHGELMQLQPQIQIQMIMRTG